jgi:saccharopine dehydrogenase-like NADP-dependent oxidoreductase
MTRKISNSATLDRLELVVEDGAVTIVGCGGADPGVSAMVAHHLAAATAIVVLCHQDRVPGRR